MVGGGVGDSYQPLEERYQLTQKTLELLETYHYPLHLLTKSTLIERDLELLQRINDHTRVIVSMSFSSVDDTISHLFEPGVPPPSQRRKTPALLSQHGIATGMFLMPVIPFITDTPLLIEQTMKQARDIGVDFIICSGMTLKNGKQKDYFITTLTNQYPRLLVDYNTIYRKDAWGQATPTYYQSLNEAFYTIAKHYHIPLRVPPRLFKDILSENDNVIVHLEHLDYLLKIQGKPSPYGYAAYSISKLSTSLSKMRPRLREIRGVGPTTERIIREILDTGTSSYYDTLST